MADQADKLAGIDGEVQILEYRGHGAIAAGELFADAFNADQWLAHINPLFRKRDELGQLRHHQIQHHADQADG